jgi:hypothetical protein
MIPLFNRRKSDSVKDLEVVGVDPATHLPLESRPTSHDLIPVIDAWPSLHESIKAAVLALVQAASAKGGGG